MRKLAVDKTMSLLEHVLRFSDQHHLLPPNASVVVAVSGGPDSLCLLHLLHRIAPQRGLQLHVAHLDHRLRPDSHTDAQFVAETAAAWGVPCTLGTVDVASLAQQTHTGLEAAGRAARYAFLIDTARKIGAQAIALGHTADDQAETVLLRLLRGAGIGGLAAMRPKRPALADLPTDMLLLDIVRPLLNTTRSEVEAYCATHQLHPRIDPTNSTGPFLRNRMRDHILPLLKAYNPSIVATLGRVARVCAEDNDLLETLANSAWQSLAQVEQGSVSFDRQQFGELHHALQRRLLRRGVQVLVPNVELEARHVDLALDAITAQRRRLQLPKGLWLHNDRRTISITADGSNQAEVNS
jgi:tRNA(Ile)-lysidine synthetase-like protein